MVSLLVLDKESFYRITEDLPEVLRAIIRKLVQYIRTPSERISNVDGSLSAIEDRFKPLG